MPRPPRVPTARVPVRRSARGAFAALAVIPSLVVALSACSSALEGPPGATDQGPAAELRLGYFATVTHAPALVGLARGSFGDALGRTALSTQVFNAGPAAIEALNAGAVDAAFLGPNPAITGFLQSEGEGLRVVSGAASGGAQLVVRPGIDSAADLVGSTLASPQLGGTQDVALRAWLAEQGLEARLRGGGDVAVTPTANALALQLFQDDSLDGVWAPEPWSSRLVLEAGGHVLVDERELWPDGAFPTTYLVVSSRYLAEHPDTVRALLTGLLDALDWMDAHREESATVVSDSLEDLTGQALRPDVLQRALEGVNFGPDPLAATLADLHGDAIQAGTAPDDPLTGILDLRLLNAALAERGTAAVPEAGLGQDQSSETERRGMRMSTMTAASGPGPIGPGAGTGPAGARAGVAPDDGAFAVRLAGVGKRYSAQGPTILEGIDLDIRRGEFVCILGASGCGKSTLLSLIAGLERPTTGQIAVAAPGAALMFQEPALFPWLTARGNVELALRLHGAPRAERRERAEELLDLVRLSGAGEKRVHELSGGMRQRVALARSLAQDRDVLLMDEPFAALDAITRDLLHDELERIWHQTGRTIVFITHNVREAVRLGQKVLLMSSRPGRIVREWRVDVTGARRIEAPDVSRLAVEITDHLREEIRRHAH